MSGEYESHDSYGGDEVSSFGLSKVLGGLERDSETLLDKGSLWIGALVVVVMLIYIVADEVQINWEVGLILFLSVYMLVHGLKDKWDYRKRV
jgi:hypothetical protein